MAGKWFPTTHYELKRRFRDFWFDLRLSSESGRKKIWDGLDASGREHGLIGLLESTLGLPGDVIECGVYRGGSLVRIARSMKDNAPDKLLYGFDSFEGFPQDKIDQRDLGPGRKIERVKRKFQMCADVPSRLMRFFDLFSVNAKLVAGFFSDTLPTLSDDQRFCFIHLDVDLYQSYIECLDALYDRLTPGGVIVFDEGDSDVWPGARLAIDEFFADRPESLEKCTDRKYDSYFIRKVDTAATRAA